eukprot:GHVQ01018119.1.p1 GENE.GHVQ01018119.1~~GHVQ01018119.1.p1  ORF type:complete len:318 (-),score=36.47 GHVQ01018119.1:638-1591(-)
MKGAAGFAKNEYSSRVAASPSASSEAAASHKNRKSKHHVSTENDDVTDSSGDHQEICRRRMFLARFFVYGISGVLVAFVLRIAISLNHTPHFIPSALQESIAHAVCGLPETLDTGHSVGQRFREFVGLDSMCNGLRTEAGKGKYQHFQRATEANSDDDTDDDDEVLFPHSQLPVASTVYLSEGTRQASAHSNAIVNLVVCALTGIALTLWRPMKNVHFFLTGFPFPQEKMHDLFVLFPDGPPHWLGSVLAVISGQLYFSLLDELVYRMVIYHGALSISGGGLSGYIGETNFPFHRFIERMKLPVSTGPSGSSIGVLL